MDNKPLSGENYVIYEIMQLHISVIVANEIC